MGHARPPLPRQVSCSSSVVRATAAHNGARRPDGADEHDHGDSEDAQRPHGGGSGGGRSEGSNVVSSGEYTINASYSISPSSSTIS